MLRSPEIVKKEIESGKSLLLAGDEELLKTLPHGAWIAGTTSCFMEKAGMITAHDRIDVTELPHPALLTFIRWYDESEQAAIAANTPDPGFTFLILPPSSPVLLAYARHAFAPSDLAPAPIIGWISGVFGDDLGKKTPKAMNGKTGELSDAKGIAMHCSLPAGKTAVVGVINMFAPGNGDEIAFETDGFFVEYCLVNGRRTRFADYLLTVNRDLRLPLVAESAGTVVNVGIQRLDEMTKRVFFYTPVFHGVNYRLAVPVGDVAADFPRRLLQEKITPVFSCNSICNFIDVEREGIKSIGCHGPIAFGGIAYQFPGQMLACLEIR